MTDLIQQQTEFQFSVFQISTGRLLRGGTTYSEAQVKIQASGDDEVVVLGEFDPDRSEYKGGKVCEKDPDPIIVTPKDIKFYAARLLSYTDWYVTRKIETGQEIPKSVLADRKRIRDEAEALEGMEPIPENFKDLMNGESK